MKKLIVLGMLSIFQILTPIVSLASRVEQLPQTITRADPTYLVAVKKGSNDGHDKTIFCKEGSLSSARALPGVLVFDYDDSGNKINFTVNVELDKNGLANISALAGVILSGQDSGGPVINAAMSKIPKTNYLIYLNGQTPATRDSFGEKYNLFLQINGVQDCNHVM